LSFKAIFFLSKIIINWIPFHYNNIDVFVLSHLDSKEKIFKKTIKKQSVLKSQTQSTDSEN